MSSCLTNQHLALQMDGWIDRLMDELLNVSYEFRDACINTDNVKL